METAQILLVDDDPMLLQALPQTIALRMIGVEVKTVDSAEKALAFLGKQEYDAIVSDIKMPGIDGLELLARVQEQHPDTPVLLITGHSDHNLAIQALRGGAYDYILKPIDREECIAALYRALNTRQLRRQIAGQQQALERYALSLEHLVEQRTQELAAANKAKETILTLVTQELSTLLSSLQGTAPMCAQPLQQVDGIEKACQGLAHQEHPLERLAVLLHDLQDILLLQTNRLILHWTTCDLVQLCQQVLDVYSGTTGAVSTLEALEDPLKIEADPERIKQVLLTLLSQARASSPQGSPLALLLRRKGTEVVLSVYSQGSSIPVGCLLHLREPLDQVPPMEMQSGSSAGETLSFSLVQALVEQQGGRLVVQTSPEGGRTFSIALPLARSSGSA